MENFTKIKKKIFTRNLRHNSFGIYEFIFLKDVDQKKYFHFLNKSRIKKSLKTKKKITYKSHLKYVKNYKNINIINYVLIASKTKEIIGSFNIKKTNIGFQIGKSILNEKFLGKGLAKKSTILLIDFFFKILKKKTIYAITSIKNNRNINLNIKLGFTIKKIINNHYIMKLTDVRFYNFCFKKK